jgi:hypothetical protein
MKSHVFAAGALSAALSLFYAGNLWAQDAQEDGDEEPTTPAPDPDAKPAGAAQARAISPAKDPPANTNESVGFVDRLPPSAFPEWRTRGIPDGSLRSTFHGMPWPYYPKNGIGVSGSLWIDTGYQSVVRGNPADPDSKLVLSQGRGVLRFTPTVSSGNWYAQGQAELVGNKDQTVGQPLSADLDDLWIRAGQWKSWDVQLGRFEAFEVYHFGMGMDLNTLERLGALGTATRSPPDVFELGGNSNIVYRQSGPTNIAFHAYPTETLRFELLGQAGFDTASGIDTVGGRPAVVLDFGFLKLKGAADYRRQFPSSNASKERRTVMGGAFAVQVVIDPIFELGVNTAFGKIRHYNPTNATNPNAPLGDFDAVGSVTDFDTGGFANVRLADGLVLGGGVNYNQQKDEAAGIFTHLQSFGALQYRVLKSVFIKAVGSYAKGHIAPGGVPSWDNTMTSGRLRVLYLF